MIILNLGFFINEELKNFVSALLYLDPSPLPVVVHELDLELSHCLSFSFL